MVTAIIADGVMAMTATGAIVDMRNCVASTEER